MKRNTLSYPLQTGLLDVTIEKKHPAVENQELFRIAERYNPKRSFLFISTVLGKHYPAKVSEMNQAFEQLAGLLPPDIENYAVIGMAETAVALGTGIYQSCENRFGMGFFATSTRHPLNSKLISNFSEPHSHATEHCLCEPSNARIGNHLALVKDLILVDDELTTGRTMSNLAQVLLKTRFQGVRRIFVLSLTDWSRGDLNINLSSGMGSNNIEPSDKGSSDIEVNFLSLIKGHYQWSPNGNSFDLPSFIENSDHCASRMASIQSPRNWIDSSDALEQHPIAVTSFLNALKPKQKVLIVGTGEFMSKPLRVAQEAENRGAEAYFCSTTRSPAMCGNDKGYFKNYGVTSRLVFSDIYLNHGANYLYNYDIEDWDHVLFYTDALVDNLSCVMLNDIKANFIASEFDLQATA